MPVPASATWWPSCFTEEQHPGQSEAPRPGALPGTPELARREQRAPQTPPKQGSATAPLCLPSPGVPRGAPCSTTPPRLSFVRIPPPSLFKVCYGTGSSSERRKGWGTTPERAPGELPLKPQLAAQVLPLQRVHESCRNPKQGSNLTAFVHLTGNRQVCSGDYIRDGEVTGLPKPVITSKLCFSLPKRPPQQGTTTQSPHTTTITPRYFRSQCVYRNHPSSRSLLWSGR